MNEFFDFEQQNISNKQDPFNKNTDFATKKHLKKVNMIAYSLFSVLVAIVFFNKITAESLLFNPMILFNSLSSIFCFIFF